MNTYKISQQSKEELAKQFEDVWKIKDLIQKEEVSEEEINLILSEIGKYPAFEVFQILENLRKTIISISQTESSNP